MNHLRLVIAAPFIAIAVILYVIYAVVAYLACLIGGQIVVDYIVRLTRSATEPTQ